MTTTIIDHNAALPASYLPTADQVVAEIDGVPLRVLRYVTFDEPAYLIHGSLPDDDQTRQLRVIIKRKFNKVKAFSFSGPVDLVQDRGLRIDLTGNPYLCLSCDGLGYIFIAFDPHQPVPDGSAVLRSEDCSISPDTETVQTAAIQRAIDQVAGSADLNTLAIGPGHYPIGDLHLRSGVRVHLAAGAVLQASDRAEDIGASGLPGGYRDKPILLSARDCEGISITGHGHVDGNPSVLDIQGFYRHMVVFSRCRDLSIQGPVFADSCGWSTTLRHCEDVSVERLKIMNNRPRIKCINTDGVNPDGCRGVRIAHCMMHTGDDAVAVKSSGYDEGAQDCCDISIQDPLAVNNSSTCKIGTETMAALMERIHFERICAVRTVRLAVIDAYDHAAISDVSWRDCYVDELPDSWHEPFLVDLRAPPPGQAFRDLAAAATARCITIDRITAAGPARARCWSRINADVRCAIDDISCDGLVSDGRAIQLEEDPA